MPDRLEEHAAELAEHFSQSTDPADLKKAVDYGEMAAKRATDVYAYGEAVRLLDQAIKVQKVLNPDDKAKQCDLLLALCDALLKVPIPGAFLKQKRRRHLPLLKVSVTALGQPGPALRLCGPLYGTRFTSVTPERAKWVEHLDRYAKPDTAERALADALLGVLKYIKGDNAAGQRLLAQALDLARRLGDRDTLWSLLPCTFNFAQRRSIPQRGCGWLKNSW